MTHSPADDEAQAVLDDCICALCPKTIGHHPYHMIRDDLHPGCIAQLLVLGSEGTIHHTPRNNVRFVLVHTRCWMAAKLVAALEYGL